MQRQLLVQKNLEKNLDSDTNFKELPHKCCKNKQFEYKLRLIMKIEVVLKKLSNESSTLL